MTKKEPLPVVGYAVGRNGEWDITGMTLWNDDGNEYRPARVFADVKGKTCRTIERAGFAIEASVFEAHAIAWLQKRGYHIDRQEQS